jgi:hypothetical protein
MLNEGNVTLDRTSTKAIVGLVFGLLALAAGGCSTPAVGAPCLPEQVPATGFDKREAYIETSSVQCETRVCMVYKLDGDPSKDCQPVACPVDEPGCTTEKKCASPTDADKSIYCTCRCDSGNSDFAECECPDNFACVPVLEQGGPGVQGSYCVRKGTFD